MKIKGFVLLATLLCFFIFGFCIFIKSNKSFKKTNYVTQENFSCINQHEITDENNFEFETFNNEATNNKGYLDISNEDFIKKANQVTVNTTYDELINIFGEHPYVVLETGVSLLTYYNDKYSFALSPGADVFLVEHGQSGQSGDGSMIEPEKP